FAFFSAASLLYTGNTGILFSVVLFPISLIALSFFKKKTIKKTITIKKSHIKLILTLACTVGLLVLLMNGSAEVVEEYTLIKITEVKELFTNRGETRTTITLKDMYHIPRNFFVFLFGTGVLGRGDFDQVPSDVGWI